MDCAIRAMKPFPPDGRDPQAEVAPESATAIIEIVRAAEKAGMAIIPCGGGTMLQTGYPPSADRPFLLLNTQRLNRILDYQPDDMTVTCESGVTLNTLQRTLAARRQRLALDVSLPDRATLGGIVAANASGFDRPIYGSPRDLLIGLRVVMAGGVEIKGGGRVVKNVAGYDVCKLFTGGWGTLGVITELTFKVQTLPETDRILAWDAPDLPTSARIALMIHHERLAATGILVTNELNGRPQLVVSLQGMARRVEWQAREYARLIEEAGLRSRPVTLTHKQVNDWRDLQARSGPKTPIAVRLSCLLTEVPDLLTRLLEFPGLAVTAHSATGIVSVAASRPDSLLPQKLQTLLPSEANLTWIRLDPDVPGADSIERWGAPRAEFQLHRSLKQSLDPGNTFSPGRFLGKL